MSGFSISALSPPIGLSPAPSPQRVSKSVTFTGAANLGAVGAVPLFTVTGLVLIQYIAGFGVLTLGQAAPTATLALGVTGSTSLFIAATTATSIATGTIWVTTTPTLAGIALAAAQKDIAISANIIGTVAAQAVNAGTLRVDCIYLPLSSDGLVA